MFALPATLDRQSPRIAAPTTNGDHMAVSDDRHLPDPVFARVQALEDENARLLEELARLRTQLNLFEEAHAHVTALYEADDDDEDVDSFEGAIVRVQTALNLFLDAHEHALALAPH